MKGRTLFIHHPKPKNRQMANEFSIKRYEHFNSLLNDMQKGYWHRCVHVCVSSTNSLPVFFCCCCWFFSCVSQCFNLGLFLSRARPRSVAYSFFFSSPIFFFYITAVLLLPQNYAITRHIIEIEILSTHLGWRIQ